MAILSIQSHVAYGHVGNSAAVFPLQRLGHEVWSVPTVLFSNHPGHGGFRGRPVEAGLIRDIVAGIGERGVLGECRAVLSGYVGTAETGRAILEAVAAVRAAAPAALFACDPVIGDEGPGIYVRAGVPEFFRDEAVPVADIVKPNAFELAWLTGRPVGTLTEARRAIDALHGRGPRVVLVSSLATEDTPREAIDMVVSEAGLAHRLRTPRLPIAPSGAGDTLAALFLAHVLAGGGAAAALARAASSVFGLLSRTVAAGSRELLTVAAQDEFVAPGRVFEAARL